MALLCCVLLMVVACCMLIGGSQASEVYLRTCSASGMEVQVVVDLTVHPAGFSSAYLQGCDNAMATGIDRVNIDLTTTFNITISMDAMMNGDCGTYIDNLYKVIIVVPAYANLITDWDKHTSLTCNFANESLQTVYADMQSINLKPTDQALALVTEGPLLRASIRNYDESVIAPADPVSPNAVTTVTVGDDIVIYVEIMTFKDYWKYLLGITLNAYERTPTNTSERNANLLSDSCPVIQMITALDLQYDPTIESATIVVRLKAFRFSNTSSNDVFFVMGVKVCALLADSGACTKSTPCPTTRRRREASDFMDQVLMQSHIEKRALDEEAGIMETDEPIATVEKQIQFKLRVRNPYDYEDGQGTGGNSPAVVPVEKMLCIPNGTAVAILVSFLVIVAFVATMSFICLTQVKRKNRESGSGIMASIVGRLTTRVPSTMLSTMEPLPYKSWSEDFVVQNAVYKAPLVEHDQLEATADYAVRPMTIYATEAQPTARLPPHPAKVAN